VSLAARDAAVLWRPYTAASAPPPIPIVAAEGAYLVAEDGRRYLDAIASWWTNVHGHAHPRLAAALAAQARTMEHVIFAGFTHEPAVALAERLVALTGLARVFYSDNGSTAVEVALKIAVQYWAARGERRARFLVLPHGYHGDTVGAMSVSGIPLFRDTFADLLFTADTWDGGTIARDVAAVLVEPMVQGAGGMRVQTPAFLRGIAERCREAGTLLIADEVMTGFGRTGAMFACEHAGVRPDIVCLAKGITGGTLPFAATVASAAVHDAFGGATFHHGHSFCANPLGCAVALESLRLFDETPVLARARAIGARIRAHLVPLRARPGVADVRGLGAIQAVELRAPDAGYTAAVGPRLYAAALERGVLLRPLGNVLYAMPPLCVTDDEADRIGATMAELARLH
jgi:adenosylmethionine-8-amino-7-oxononanoate aminotransferase